MKATEQPLVSVLMGVYQIEGLSIFSDMMESLLAQTHSNLEIIICNDGSTDATAKILSHWVSQDSRIHVLTHEKNQGLAASLNDCMKQAKGEFFARQDADDRSHITRLEEQIHFLQSNPNIDFVGTNVNLIDDRGVWGKRILPPKPQKKDFLFCSPFVHGTIVYRANVPQRAGGYFVARHTYRAEDYDLFMRLYALGAQGANLQKTLYDYQEDVKNMAKRKYRYRIDEAIVRYNGFRRLHLLPGGCPYVIKPLLVGLIPAQFLFWLKCRRKLFLKK